MISRNRYGVTIRNTWRAVRRIGRHFKHRRIGLFWLVVVIALIVPWGFGRIGQVMAPAASHPTAATGILCDVLSIHDGDTLTALCNGRKERVRFHCIDAPEMKQEPWGVWSRDHLRAIATPTVRLVERDRDRYGRMVAEVYAVDAGGGENLNMAQTWAGHAVVYPRYCRDADYYDAEQAARSARVGVWEREGKQQRPWEWRAVSR